ncbi:MAG: 4-oxalocrotonate tautomerase family protein, partial [Candidatus Bathyarchaeia archaeon]
MPVIQVDIREGRTREQIRKLQELLTSATMEAIGAPREYVYIIVRESPGTSHCLAGQPLP